jgi:hypothetical protein
LNFPVGLVNFYSSVHGWELCGTETRRAAFVFYLRKASPWQVENLPYKNDI